MRAEFLIRDDWKQALYCGDCDTPVSAYMHPWPNLSPNKIRIKLCDKCSNDQTSLRNLYKEYKVTGDTRVLVQMREILFHES